MKTSDLIETTNLFSLSEAKRVGKATRNLQNRINKFGNPWDDQPLNPPQPQDTQTDSVMNFVPGNDINTPQQTVEPATPVQATAPVQADTTTAPSRVAPQKPGFWGSLAQSWANRGLGKADSAAKANSKYYADAVYRQWARDSVSLANADPAEYKQNLATWLNNKWGANGQLTQFINTAVQTANPGERSSIYAAIQQVVNKNLLVQSTKGLTPPAAPEVADTKDTTPTNVQTANTTQQATTQTDLQSLEQRVDNLEKAMAGQGSLVETNFSAILWNKR